MSRLPSASDTTSISQYVRSQLMSNCSQETPISQTSVRDFGSLCILRDDSRPSYEPQPLKFSVDQKTPSELAFPVLLNTGGPDTQITPYFDHPQYKFFTCGLLVKTRATFMAVPLPQRPGIYSQEAIDRSADAMWLLERLFEDAEVQATTNPCLCNNVKEVKKWTTTDKNKAISIKLHTNRIFVAPDKFKNMTASTIETFPDPLGLYKRLCEDKSSAKKYQVVAPEIKDTDGSVIPPSKYHERFARDRKYLAWIRLVPCLWPFRKSGGKHVYNLVIKSMQIFPDTRPPLPTRANNPSCITQAPKSPLKRSIGQTSEDGKMLTKKQRRRT